MRGGKDFLFHIANNFIYLQRSDNWKYTSERCRTALKPEYFDLEYLMSIRLRMDQQPVLSKAKGAKVL